MIAALAGSFDPLTIGHLDLIERASRMYEKVIVLEAVNQAKLSMFPSGLRLAWIEKACAHLPNVQVSACTGVAVQQAVQLGAGVLVRGVRNGSDLEYEAGIAYVNLQIDPKVETVLLPCRPEYAYVSSSNVRELLRCGCSAAHLLPPSIAGDVAKAFATQNNAKQRQEEL